MVILIFLRKTKLESNHNYKKVYLTIQLSPDANRLLSETCVRSKRKKNQEAALRLEDHLNRYRSISELDHVIQKTEAKEALE